MKTLTLIIALGLSQLIYSQKQALKNYQIKFNAKQIVLDDATHSQIDNYFDMMPFGKTVEFSFLSKQEKKLANKEQYRLSYNRALRAEEYLLSKGIVNSKVELYFQPFVKIANGSANSNRVYRGMSNTAGIYSIIVLKRYEKIMDFTNQGDSLSDFTQPCISYDASNNYDNYVHTDKGTIIKIKTGAFVLKSNGKKPENGVVTLCIKEFYDLEDIVAADLVTISGDKMLVSGGMLHISAYAEEGELRLVSSLPLQIFMPASESLSRQMELFQGKKNRGIIDWKVDDNKMEQIKSGEPIFEFDSQDNFDGEFGEEGYYSEADGYLMEVTKLGWINCDRFYDIDKPTQLIVRLDPKKNISVRMVFHDIKSVLPAYNYAPGQSVKFDQIPRNKEVTVVAFAVNKDKTKALLGSKKITTGSVNEIDLTGLKTIEFSQLKAELAKEF